MRRIIRKKTEKAEKKKNILMEKDTPNLLGIYQNTISKVFASDIQTRMDKEDSIQTRMLYLLENKEKIQPYENNMSRFGYSLKWYAKKRQIRIYQTRDRMISLSDTDKADNILVSLDTDSDLQNWILSRTKADGKQLFSKKEKTVLKLRFQGLKAVEIAEQTSIKKGNLSKMNKRIDSKITGLPLKDMVTDRYYRGGSYGTKGKLSLWADKCQDTDRTYKEKGYRISCDTISVTPDAVGNVLWYVGSARAGSMVSYKEDTIEKDSLFGYRKRAMPTYNRIQRDMDRERILKRNAMSLHFKHNVDNMPLIDAGMDYDYVIENK